VQCSKVKDRQKARCKAELKNDQPATAEVSYICWGDTAGIRCPLERYACGKIGTIGAGK